MKKQKLILTAVSNHSAAQCTYPIVFGNNIASAILATHGPNPVS